jgi:endo-1,4-beta-xylanase
MKSILKKESPGSDMAAVSPAFRRGNPVKGLTVRHVAIILIVTMIPLTCPAQDVNRAEGWFDPDTTVPPCMHLCTFCSKLVGADADYIIYLPPDYETGSRRYPVAYWLHGRGGKLLAPALDSAIRKGVAPAMIMVVPVVPRNSMYCDSYDGKWPAESMIIKELIPHIDRTYRTIPERGARAVEGHSRGGYGAARFAFRYPDMFGAVSILAGQFELYGIEQYPDIFQEMFGMDIGRVREDNPSFILEQNAGKIRGNMLIRVLVGDKDQHFSKSQAAHLLLEKYNIEHEYEVVPGIVHNLLHLYDALGDRAFIFYRQAFAQYTSQTW